MNRLECIQAKSKYSDQPHLVLTVDGVPLDELLDGAFPTHRLLGLIPTFLDCLTDLRERELVWKRIRPPVGCVEIAPVLMCPDDCDLWCIVIVAEVESAESTICWHRFGSDGTEDRGRRPEGVGTSVEWFDGVGPYTFNRAEYEHCFSIFRGALG